MIGRKPLAARRFGLGHHAGGGGLCTVCICRSDHAYHVRPGEHGRVHVHADHDGHIRHDAELGSGSPVWPASEVDGGIWGWMHDVQINPTPAPKTVVNDPYFDQSDYCTNPDSFYVGTNPEVAQWVDTDAANHPVYFGVMPYAGDVSYTLVVKFTPTVAGSRRSSTRAVPLRQPTAPLMCRLCRVATRTPPAPGTARASTGRVAPPRPTRTGTTMPRGALLRARRAIRVRGSHGARALPTTRRRTPPPRRSTGTALPAPPARTAGTPSGTRSSRRSGRPTRRRTSWAPRLILSTASLPTCSPPA